MGATGLRTRLRTTRGAPLRGVDRVRTRLPAIAQTAVAAGIAWALARQVLPNPFFAPIAAVISLGIAQGQHLRRAVELSFGVALGIGIADVVFSLLGRNGVMVAVIVAVAMAAALLFGAGQMLVNQAAVSAVLLATLGTQPGAGTYDRFFSALIGGAVAVVVGPVLFARDPLRQIGREAQRLLDRLADVIAAVADGLDAADVDRAAEALELARSTDAEFDAYEDVISAAREALRLSPPRRRDLPRSQVYADAAEQVDYAVRNTRVLARTAQTAVARGVPVDAELIQAVRLLGDAVRALGQDLREPTEDSEARRLARRAAEEATAVLDRRSDLSSHVLVSTVRSTAADLLRGSGMDTQEMHVALGPYPGAEG